MMDILKKLSLGKRILIGIVIGLTIGFISADAADFLSPIGTAFLRLLKMLIVPLVFLSIISGICKMGNTKQLRTVGFRFILYIIITSGMAATIGVVAGLILDIGSGTTEFLDTTAQVQTVSYSFINNMVSWIPENIVGAMVTGDMLQIIVFSVFVGVALLSLGEQVKGLVSLIDQGTDTMLKITEFVMNFSPIGIASLMATMVTKMSGATLQEVITFIIADNVIALFLLFLFPFMFRALTKLSGYKFMKNITAPMIVAISTTSSAATLPVSIRTAEEKLGVPENIYGFTLPLGNTCGMNGFAMFLGLFSVFASNVYGLPITLASVAQFIFLGIILSIGAAGVKGAGIVMSTILLETLGMPLTLVPILAAIWPVLDPAHTILNNVSDLAGTTIIAKQLGQLDEKVFENS